MDKKKLIYIICGVLLIALLIGFVFNSNKKEQKNNSYTSSKRDTRKTDKTNSNFFEFKDDGTTISGLTEEGSKQKKLVIPEQTKSLMGLVLADSEVEEISFAANHDVALASAFATAEKVKKVDLPAELSIIPFMAFGSCTGIESIKIPAGVTKIDEYAFSNCENLKEVSFEGNRCEIICLESFFNCDFENITLPEGLKTIENRALFQCKKLTSVRIPSTIKSIGENAFNSPNLSEAHFAANVENVKIEPTAFGVRTSDMTVYIVKDSWMDKNRDAWNVGFTNIVYE